MRIRKLKVSNYRAVSEAEIDVNAVTSIIGENNSGKSAFLRAIDLFFDSAPNVKPEDFHLRQVEKPIEITITFGGLTPDERNLFGEKVVDGTMTVTRQLTIGGDKSYLISALGNPAFSDIRGEQAKREKINKYNEIRESYGLPAERSSDNIEGHFAAWEAENPDRLVMVRQSGFFGADNVAVGRLKAKTEFVFVPAIKDVREEIEQKSSAVRTLLAGIAKQAIENSEDFKKFIAASEQSIRELTSPDNAPRLKDISAHLTEILKRYYSEAALKASWAELTGLPITLPTPDIKVKDGIHETDVDYVGHGMQRAIILTLLEYIAQQAYSTEGEFVEAASDIIIAIEEPELFQHPTKQRLFYKTLSEIAENFNKENGIRIQILYATHSPLLVEFPDIDRVRLIRKDSTDAGINITVNSISLQRCADEVAGLRGFKPSASRYGAGLHVITPDVAEGLFGKKVILVEGMSDVAILEAAYLIRNRDTLSEGIVIKSVGGKKNMDRPLLIFERLGIPTYSILDNDRGEHEGKDSEGDEIGWHKFYQELCGCEHIEDWPDTVGPRLAGWDGNVEKYISEASGRALYDKSVEEMSSNFSIAGRDCVKSPSVASAVLSRLVAQGVIFDKLDAIVAAVDEL